MLAPFISEKPYLLSIFIRLLGMNVLTWVPVDDWACRQPWVLLGVGSGFATLVAKNVNHFGLNILIGCCGEAA